MLMVGLPVAGYAFYKLRMSFYRNISYLWRSYWRWLFASALAVTALALSIHYTAKSIPQVTSFEKIIYDREVALRAEYCETGGHAARLQCSVGPFFDTLERSAVNMICRGENLLQGGNRDCKADLRGLYLIGVFVLLAQQLVWMICFVLMTVILFLHMILWFRWRSDPVLYHRVPSLASVALSSMALFWILLLCCIWAVGFLLDENFAGNFQLFKAAFVLVWINWLFAIALAVGAGLILLIPFARWKRAVTPETYFHDGETPRPAPRLIVSTSLAILTMLCPVFLLVLSIVSLLRDEAIYFHDWNQMNVIAGFAYDHFRRILFMSAAVGVALYAFREQLRIGIGLGSDVINYFRVLDYHPDPKTADLLHSRADRAAVHLGRPCDDRAAPPGRSGDRRPFPGNRRGAGCVAQGAGRRSDQTGRAVEAGDHGLSLYPYLWQVLSRAVHRSRAPDHGPDRLGEHLSDRRFRWHTYQRAPGWLARGSAGRLPGSYELLGRYRSRAPSAPPSL